MSQHLRAGRTRGLAFQEGSRVRVATFAPPCSCPSAAGSACVGTPWCSPHTARPKVCARTGNGQTAWGACHLPGTHRPLTLTPASAASSPVGWTWDGELSGPDSLLVSQGRGDHRERGSAQRQVEGLIALTGPMAWPLATHGFVSVPAPAFPSFKTLCHIWWRH